MGRKEKTAVNFMQSYNFSFFSEVRGLSVKREKLLSPLKKTPMIQTTNFLPLWLEKYFFSREIQEKQQKRVNE